MIITCNLKDKEEMTVSVVAFAIAKLFPKFKKFTIDVEYESMGRWEYGYAEQYANKYFVITLKDNMSLKNTIMTLLHEMVHVKQYLKGELRLGYKEKVWKGRKWNGDDYTNYPWEKEARKLEESLYAEYVEFMKAKELMDSLL